MSDSLHCSETVTRLRELHKKELKDLENGELFGLGKLNDFDNTRPTVGNKYFKKGSERELAKVDVRKKVNQENKVVRIYDRDSKEYICVITKFCCIYHDCPWCKSMKFAQRFDADS